MKEKLIELLGLTPANGQNEVTDNQVVSAVADLQSQFLRHHGAMEYENEISAVIREAPESISRETAKEIIAQRKREAGELAAGRKI